MTKQDVWDMLDSLQWKRLTKAELTDKLNAFFGVHRTLEDGTDPEFKDIDYSFLYTTAEGSITYGFIDIEIYYLKMRDRKTFLITGAELLEFQP